MTGQRFCGSCGTALATPPQPFCTSCGRPTTAAAPVPAPAPAPAPHQPNPDVLGVGGPPPAVGGRRRWPVVVAGVAALAVVGGGVVAATTLLGGGDVRTSDGTPLPSAVTSEPEEQWTYDYAGDYLSAAAGVGDRVVLVDENGDVVGLDSDGDRDWTSDDHAASYLLAVPGHDDLVIVAGGEAGGVGAISVDDGHELWWADSGYPVATLDGGLLIVDGSEESSTTDLLRADPESGDEKWRMGDVSNFGVGGDTVYAVEDGELSRLDWGSGKADWSVEVPFDDLEDYVQLAVTDKLVAMADDDVWAYDSESGDELWTYSPDDPDADVSIGAFSEDRVYVSESSYDEEFEVSSSAVTVRDREGTVGEIDLDDDEYLYGSGLESGGKSWFVDLGNGDTYDEEVQRVASYDGTLTLADKGVYAVDSDSISFHEYGEDRAAWELDLPDDDSETRSVYAVDDALLVVDDGELTSYR